MPSEKDEASATTVEEPSAVVGPEGPEPAGDAAYEYGGDDEPAGFKMPPEGDAADGSDEGTTGGDKPTGDAGDDEGADGEPAGPALDPALVAKGQALGMSPEDFQAFGTDALLGRAVGLLEARVDAGAPEGEPPAAGEPGATGDGEKPDKGEFKLDLDGYDEGLVKQLQGLTEHVNATVRDLRGELDQTRTLLAGQQSVELTNWFDGQIAGLGDEYKPILGEGPGSKMDREGEPFKKRCALLDEIDALEAGRHATGQSPLSREELFQRALTMQCSDGIKAQARKELSEQLTKRRGLHVARPTQRDVKKAASPEKEAANFAEGYMKDRGIDADETDEALQASML